MKHKNMLLCLGKLGKDVSAANAFGITNVYDPSLLICSENYFSHDSGS